MRGALVQYAITENFKFTYEQARTEVQGASRPQASQKAAAVKKPHSQSHVPRRCHGLTEVSMVRSASSVCLRRKSPNERPSTTRGATHTRRTFRWTPTNTER